MQKKQLRYAPLKWLSAYKLSQIFSKSSTEINAILDATRPYMSYAIKPFKNNRCESLYLSEKYMDEFAKMHNLQKRDTKQIKKTSQWLNADEISHRVNTTIQHINEVLEQTHKNNPDIVKFVKHKHKIMLCLHVDKLDEWIKDNNLCKIEIDSNEWVSINELNQYYSVSNSAKQRVLKTLYKTSPHIILRKNVAHKILWYIRKENLNELEHFPEFANKKVCITPIKNDNWLTASEISELYHTPRPATVARNLQMYRRQNPDAVQTMSFMGKKVVCLNKEFLGKFARKYKIHKRNLKDYTNYQWLSASVLMQDYVCGSLKLIQSHMQSLQNDMPHAFQYKSFKTHNVLCLNKEHLNEFIQKSGLTSKQARKEFMSPKLMNVRQLQKNHIIGTNVKISKKLVEYADKMPHAIFSINVNGQKQYKLHCDFIEDFCKLSGLELSTQPQLKKTSAWKSAVEVTELLESNLYTCQIKIKELHTIMPYAIQYKKTKRKTTLCLHIDYIDEFCKLANLNKRDFNITEKTPEWKTAYELSASIVSGSSATIKNKMTIMQKHMPHAIQEKYNHGKRILCVNQNNIAEFCEQSHLKYSKEILKYILDNTHGK